MSVVQYAGREATLGTLAFLMALGATEDEALGAYGLLVRKIPSPSTQGLVDQVRLALQEFRDFGTREPT